MTASGNALAIGVDLGGTATRFVALDREHVVVRQIIESTPAVGAPDEVVRFLCDGMRRVAADDAIGSIGIGASGPIDAGGIIRNTETLPAFTGIAMLQSVERALAVRPRIENDAVTAALGEYRLGAGKGSTDLLMITLGTGVGVCLLQGGRPFRGAGGAHPEASHLSIPGPPAPCYCGRATCWEQLASRSSLQRAAGDLFADATRNSSDIERAELLASRGDAAASTMFERFGTGLGEGLATLMAAYAPDTVVIGGSGGAYLPMFGPSLDDLLASRGLGDVTLVRAQLGEYGGAVGAALLDISLAT